MSKTYIYVASNVARELIVGMTKFPLDVELVRLASYEPWLGWDRIVYVEEFSTLAEAYGRRKALVRIGKKRLRAKILKRNPEWQNLAPVVAMPVLQPWKASKLDDNPEPPGSSGVRSPLLPPDRPLVGRFAEPVPVFYEEEQWTDVHLSFDYGRPCMSR